MTVKVTKPALNLREELSSLKKPSGVAGEAMLRAETPQEQFNLIGAGRKNLIINGDCRISQRGDFTTASSSSDETYYLDRFEHNHAGVSINKQHITANQPSELSNTNSWKLSATSSASGFFGARQTIEDYLLFNGRSFTVSAYIKTNHPSVRFYLYNGSTVYAGKNSATNDGEWHRLEETFNFDATSGTRFSVEIIALSEAGSSVSITSGDYIEFTGVQLELGSVATPFEHRSYGEELALCQRYYVDLNLYGLGMGNAYSVNAWVYQEIPLPVTMRAVPAVTYTGGSQGPWATSSVARGAAGVSPDFVNVYGKTNAAVLDYYVSGAFNVQADAEL